MASTSSIRPSESVSVASGASNIEERPPPASSVVSSSYRVSKGLRAGPPARDPVWQHARKHRAGIEPRTVVSGSTSRTLWYCKYDGCDTYSTLSTVCAGNHLLSAHSITTGDIPVSKVAQKIQRDLQSFTKPLEEARRQKDELLVKEGLRSAANPATIGQALLRLIVHHDLALSFVEWPEVHTFVIAINYQAAGCIWSSHQTTANRVAKTYRVRQQQLKEQLQQSRSLVHLTTDTWNSPNNKELQAITAHFVDDEGRLQKALLALPELDNGHSGVGVARYVLRAINCYGFKERVGYITTDNATCNDTLCEELSKELVNWKTPERRLRCVGPYHQPCSAGLLC